MRVHFLETQGFVPLRFGMIMLEALNPNSLFAPTKRWILSGSRVNFRARMVDVSHKFSQEVVLNLVESVRCGRTLKSWSWACFYAAGLT